MNTALIRIYEKLLAEYGHQGWWPVTPEGKLNPEYHVSNHTEKQRLEIIFGSVLTQNTQWKPNVERAMTELSRRSLIDVDSILSIRQDELAALIRSAGYYNQKAKKLRQVAMFLKKYPISTMKRMPMKKVREMLLHVNGIGPETADSILLYALEKPAFVVDAYTKRIFHRLGIVDCEARYDDIQAVFMEGLNNDALLFNEYHALIVQHAKQSCRKTPVCNMCPTSGFCHYTV
jgi:endonuclease III related protein